MALDTRIILAGQAPNVLNAVAGGMQAGQQYRDFSNQNQLNAAVQKYGSAAMGGDRNALNSLASMGTQGMELAQGTQMNSLNMDNTRQQMQVRGQQMDILSEQERRAAEQYAAGLTAAEAAAKAAEIENAVKMGMLIDTPEQWDAMAAQSAPELLGRFAERDQIAAGYMSFADIVKMRAGPEPLSPEGKFYQDQAAGLIPSDATQGGDSAKEQEITRIMRDQGVDRRTAQGVADGVLRVSQDPTTREIMVTNLATGETYMPTLTSGPGQQPQVQQAPAQPIQQAPAQENPSFGDAFQGAQNSFGIQGVARGLANTAADATGFQVPFPQDLQTRQDFEVLGESLVNDFASAYGRQPPSWLLKNIAELVPQAGRTFEGPQRAQTKLKSIARDMESRKMSAESSLRRRMTPAERQEALALIAGIDATLARVNSALQGFQGGGGQSGNRTSSGVSWSVEE